MLQRVIIQPGGTQESGRACYTICVINGEWVFGMFGMSAYLHETLIFFLTVFGGLFSLSLHELTLSPTAPKSSPKSSFEMLVNLPSSRIDSGYLVHHFRMNASQS